MPPYPMVIPQAKRFGSVPLYDPKLGADKGLPQQEVADVGSIYEDYMPRANKIVGDVRAGQQARSAADAALAGLSSVGGPKPTPPSGRAQLATASPEERNAVLAGLKTSEPSQFSPYVSDAELFSRAHPGPGTFMAAGAPEYWADQLASRQKLNAARDQGFSTLEDQAAYGRQFAERGQSIPLEVARTGAAADVERQRLANAGNLDVTRLTTGAQRDIAGLELEGKRDQQAAYMSALQGLMQGGAAGGGPVLRSLSPSGAVSFNAPQQTSPVLLKAYENAAGDFQQALTQDPGMSAPAAQMVLTRYRAAISNLLRQDPSVDPEAASVVTMALSDPANATVPVEKLLHKFDNDDGTPMEPSKAAHIRDLILRLRGF